MFAYLQGYPDWKKSGYPVEVLGGFVMDVDIPTITAGELKSRLDKGEASTLVDLRDSEDRGIGTIKGARWIPLEDLMARHGEIPKANPVYLLCLRGKQGGIAAKYLANQGYTKVAILDNGIQDGWLAAGYPLEKIP